MLRPLLVLLALLAACNRSRSSAGPGCDDSIKLPRGFCARVYYDSAGAGRHLVVRKNGDVIVGVLDQRREAGGIVLLRDRDKDGRADAAQRFGESGVHGLALSGDSVLYASTATEVLRYRLTDSLLPKRRVDTVITGLAKRPIPSHSLAIDRRGNLIVGIGALSNGCAARELPGAAGRDPCPDLIGSAGIWTYRTDRVGQHTLDGTRIATGLHNPVALAVSPADTMVYAVSHGRDEVLHDLWPALYSDEESASLAAEEMVRIATPRADFGWPYCYYDYLKQGRVLAPEYGGNKELVGRCDRLIQPLIAFPAHWSPMSMVFYTGKMFPPSYQGGIFIAFHGSAFRAPLAQDGYQVVFLQFKDGLPGDYSVFASGFAGPMVSPEGALHRPVGLAQGPDGALYLSDDKGGRIWKIVYEQAAATKH